MIVDARHKTAQMMTTAAYTYDMNTTGSSGELRMMIGDPSGGTPSGHRVSTDTFPSKNISDLLNLSAVKTTSPTRAGELLHDPV